MSRSPACPGAPSVYPFDQTILAWRGSLAPGPRVTQDRGSYRRAWSAGPGPRRTRYREKQHGCDRTANEPPVAGRLVAKTIPTAAEDGPERHRVLPAARCQRRDVLLMEETCP